MTFAVENLDTFNSLKYSLSLSGQKNATMSSLKIHPLRVTLHFMKHEHIYKFCAGI